MATIRRGTFICTGPVQPEGLSFQAKSWVYECSTMTRAEPVGLYVPPDSISMHPELNVFQFTISPRALSVDYPEWDLFRELVRSRLVLMSVE